MTEAKTDVMILGATGFVGRLVARNLIAHRDFTSGKFTFSLAGRSTDKIKKLQAELGIETDKVRVVEVDVLKEASVAAAIQTTKVVIDVVGPYWKWGKAVAHACAKEGVHYVDLTGEPPYMKWLVDECHTLAEQTGAVLIPCCGFDSIPSDISAYLSNRTLKENSSDAALDSSVTAIQAKGGISGGTMDTMFTIMEDVPPKLRSASIKSFSFSPVRGVRQVTFNFLYSLPLYPHITGGYYFMTVCNRLVVQRTWGLGQVELAAKKDDAGAQSRAYGPRFAYSEFMSVPGGKIGGFIVSALTLLFGLLVAISPIRAFIKRFAIQPGSGPSEKTMQNGYFLCTNVSTSSKDHLTGKPTYVRSILRGRGDPGYLLTSMMISECALALALEKDALPPLAHRGGVLTPMSGLGDVLLRRLERTRRFEFESSIVDDDGTPA